MNTLNLNSKWLIILISIIIFSCVKNVDFNQPTDIEISPTMEVSLIYFQEPTDTFVDDDDDERETIVDTVAIDIFSDPFVRDNLVKADFYIETNNSISREFEVQLEFLNFLNEIEHIVTIQAESSPDNIDIISEHIEIFEGQTLEALKNTTSIILTASMQDSVDGSILLSTSPGELILKSKGVFFLNINTSE